MLSWESDEEHEPLYHVRYEDDGDEEDLSFDELKRCGKVYKAAAPVRRSTRTAFKAQL